jgi:hypothetical protein
LTGNNLEALKQNLIDSCRHFLGTGEFQILNELHGRLMDCSLSAITMKSSQVKEIVSIFNKPEFVEEVLNGLRIWEKEKYPYIQKLILQIGEPFVEPVLNHLAKNPVCQPAFLIDCLLKWGKRGIGPFTVAGQKMVFCKESGQSCVTLMILDPPPIRRLSAPTPQSPRGSFQNSSCSDPVPPNTRHLSGKDKEAKLVAIGLAENCQSVEVVNMLIKLLNRGSILRSGIDLKKKIIQTLGRMRDPSILPHLQRIFQSNSLLHRNALNQLKAEIVVSLNLSRQRNGIDHREALTWRKSGTRQPDFAKYAPENYSMNSGQTEKVYNFVRRTMMAISNVFLYSFDHPQVRNLCAKGTLEIKEAMGNDPEISFMVIDGELIHDGILLKKGLYFDRFAELLANRGIQPQDYSRCDSSEMENLFLFGKKINMIHLSSPNILLGRIRTACVSGRNGLAATDATRPVFPMSGNEITSSLNLKNSKHKSSRSLGFRSCDNSGSFNRVLLSPGLSTVALHGRIHLYSFH